MRSLTQIGPSVNVYQIKSNKVGMEWALVIAIRKLAG